MKNLFKTTFAYIATVSLVIAIVFGVMAIGTVNSSTYKHYENQYNECFSGYLDCISAANSTTNSYYKASFRNLADTYSDLMDSWESRMDELEARATVFGVISGAFLVSTAAFVVLAIKKGKTIVFDVEAIEEDPADENLVIEETQSSGEDEIATTETEE